MLRKNVMFFADEATIMLVTDHITSLAMQFSDGISYIEDLLAKQLVAAIGKQMTHVDIGAFVCFHKQGLFGPNFRPKPFCHAIRQHEQFLVRIWPCGANSCYCFIQ